MDRDSLINPRPGQQSDTELQQLHKIGGDRNPVQESRYQELRRQTGGQGGSASSSVTDIARQLAAATREISQPAIQRLESTAPQISERFGEARRQLETEKEPLKQRYKSILDDITRREKRETEATQLRTSREFGRRGIPLSSGVFEEQLAENLRPTSEFFSNLAQRTGLEQESELRNIQNLLGNLTVEESGALSNLQKAIASIEAAAAPSAVSGALNIFGLEQSSSERALDRALQQQSLNQQSSQNALINALAQRQFEEVTLPSFQAQQEANPLNLELLRAQINRTNKLSSNQPNSKTTNLPPLDLFFGG